MTFLTPDAPVQLANVDWSTNVVVSMDVTGAPGITVPCGHVVQPKAFLASFRRGTLPEMTKEVWDLEEWKIYAVHPKTSPFGKETELVLSQRHFGEGADLNLPAGLLEEMTAALADMGMDLPPDLSQGVQLLGPVPEWVTTAIKSYQPNTTLQPPVRTTATYHG
jgi:hypothetical protein